MMSMSTGLGSLVAHQRQRLDWHVKQRITALLTIKQVGRASCDFGDACRRPSGRQARTASSNDIGLYPGRRKQHPRGATIDVRRQHHILPLCRRRWLNAISS